MPPFGSRPLRSAPGPATQARCKLESDAQSELQKLEWCAVSNLNGVIRVWNPRADDSARYIVATRSSSQSLSKMMR
jgi:hypothetical protein